MSTDTLVLLLIFEKMFNILNVLFFDDDVMKKVNNFQIAKVQPQLLGICLIFCQFQPGIAYKTVA